MRSHHAFGHKTTWATCGAMQCGVGLPTLWDVCVCVQFASEAILAHGSGAAQSEPSRSLSSGDARVHQSLPASPFDPAHARALPVGWAMNCCRIDCGRLGGASGMDGWGAGQVTGVLRGRALRAGGVGTSMGCAALVVCCLRWRVLSANCASNLRNSWAPVELWMS